MCVGVLPADICTPCAHSSHRGQKKPLELELHTVGIHHISVENKTWVFQKRRSGAHDCLAISPAPACVILFICKYNYFAP